MEEEKLVEQKPMSQEEFEGKIHEVLENNRKKVEDDFDKGILYLKYYVGVSKYKSIRRAIRRGHVSIWGELFPRRPYNNRKLNPQRKKLREIYEQVIKRI